MTGLRRARSASPCPNVTGAVVVSAGHLSAGIVAARIVAACVLSAVGCGSAGSEEILFTGGNILTMDRDRPRVEALLIREGRIVVAGSLTEATAAEQSARRHDLRGTTLLPGLVEAHTHPLASALLGTSIDVSAFSHTTRHEVMASLREGAQGWNPGPWTIAFGWDPLQIEGLTPPSLAELDEISPDRPLVVLTQMMHDAYVNTAALRAAGIDRSTKDPPGAEFVRDADGELTGEIHEVAGLDRILSARPSLPSGVSALLLNLQLGEYARAGYTTIGVLGPVGGAKNPLTIFENLASTRNVPVRTVVYALPDQLEGYHPTAKSSARFRVRGVKFWMDGSPFTGGAAVAEPYARSGLVTDQLHLPEGHRGSLHQDPETFATQFKRHHVAGRQIAVHTQGERAIDLVLATVAETLRDHPRTDHRHRLEHNALITPAQIEAAHDLGMTLSFFVDHIYFYGHRLEALFGSARRARYMPFGTARAAGHRATLHSDNPATPIAPLRVVRTAVTRLPRTNGPPVAENEAVTIQTALEAMTIDAAWQFGMEDEIGSLKAGKAADLTLLSADPLATTLAALTDIKVLGTWIDGRPVHPTRWNLTNGRLAVRAAWQVFISRLRGS